MNNPMNTLNELKQLIHDKFEIDPATLDADTPMAEYGLDSLALAEFLFSVEDHFHVSFPDAQMQVGTLAGLADVLDLLLAEKAPQQDSEQKILRAA